MSNQFPLLHKKFNELVNIHQISIGSFTLYKTIRKLRAQNIVGQDNAEANDSAMNDYKGVFTLVERIAYDAALINLAKLYDTHKKSFHLDALTYFTGQDQNQCTNEDFAKFHHDKDYVDELVKYYNSISPNDVAAMKANIENRANIIRKLINIRNSFLSHNDIKKPEIYISMKEIDELITLSEDILGFISASHFKTNINEFEVAKNEVEWDVERLVSLIRANKL